MRSVARPLLLLLFILCRAALVSAAPTLSFPINSQVPPVARIGEPFSFIFSSTTFTSASSSGSISYSLVDPPSWLSLDSASRTLYGTPEDGDVVAGEVVGVNVTLVATDSTGSTSDDATLVVSRSEGPTVQIPVSEQIQDFGNYSEPSSILYYPVASFKFAFATDTFADANATVLNYYPVMQDNSPLPAWITFDPSTLAFAGTTPPFSSLVEPPQTFPLKLIASDVTGFAGASLDFSIVVGMHTLTTDQPDIVLNATAGKSLSYEGLAGSIQIDGRAADSTDVTSKAQNLPSWLSFDKSSWNISGTPPDDAPTTNFTVTFQDGYGDLLNVTIDVQLAGNGSFFQTAFPSLSVKPGEQVDFKVGDYLVDSAAVDVTTDIQPATSWLAWDTSTLTLSGDVPESAPESTVDVTFTVTSKSSTTSKRAADTQSQKLVIQIAAADGATSSSTSTSTSSAATSTSPASASSASPAEGAPKWTIIAIVICAVAALAFIACLCFCCYNRRRKNRRRSGSTINTIRTSTVRDASLIETPGRAIGSSEPQSVTPPSEKKKSKLRKSTYIQAGATTPPVRPPRSPLESPRDLHNQELPSTTSTPASRLKDFVSSLRSFRVVHMRRARAPSPSDVYSDYGSSHHDFDFDPDLEIASSQPPVLPIPLPDGGSERSLQEDIEADSQRIIEGNRNPQGLPTPTPSSIRLVEGDPFTDAPPNIARAVTSPISPVSEREAFTSHPITPITPIFPLQGPSSAFAMTPSSAITPSSAGGPSSLIPSSALLPTSSYPVPRRAATTPSRLPGLRSQRSNASASSTDTMRARTRNKLSAKAKGALFALQSPKRRTLAALGKKPSFQFVPRKKRSHRGVLESVDCDSESVLGGHSNDKTRSASRAGGGIAGFLSPRLWPQPASGSGRSVSITSPKPRDTPGVENKTPEKNARDTEGTEPASGGSFGSSQDSPGSDDQSLPIRVPQPPIRRRPVPAPAGAAASRASDESGALGTNQGLRGSASGSSLSSVRMPSPLRTPGMSGTPVSGGGGVSSGAGLGITTYEDIVRSSPLHPSREVSEDADMDVNADIENDADLDTDRTESWTTAGVGTILDRERERRGSMDWTSTVSESAPGSLRQPSTKSSAAGARMGRASDRYSRVFSDGFFIGDRGPIAKTTEGRQSVVSGKSAKSGKSKTSSDIGAFV